MFTIYLKSHAAADRFSSCPAPVSYTHLDVYKRQVTVQWQAAVLFVVVGTERSNQLLDPLLLPARQLTIIV